MTLHREIDTYQYRVISNIQRDGIQRDGIQRDGIQRDGIQRDGIQRDGIQRDGIQINSAHSILRSPYLENYI